MLTFFQMSTLTINKFIMYIILVTALAFFKANLGNMICIVKFKLFVVDIWKKYVHLLIY